MPEHPGKGSKSSGNDSAEGRFGRKTPSPSKASKPSEAPSTPISDDLLAPQGIEKRG